MKEQEKGRKIPGREKEKIQKCSKLLHRDRRGCDTEHIQRVIF